MSVDNTDRTTLRAPPASDDVAPSSPTASMPTTRTQAANQRSEKVTVDPADQPVTSPFLASLIGKANRASQSSSPAPQITAAQAGKTAMADAGTDINNVDIVDTTDDVVHGGTREKGAEATDDGGDTLNLREQASFPVAGD